MNTNALEPLLPILQSLEPFGLPSAALQGWYTYANQRQTARFAKHLEYELNLIHQKLSTRLNRSYIGSEEFETNVVQAVRAAETAGSSAKMELISKALAGCMITGAEIENKTLLMRIIDSLTVEEINFLSEISISFGFSRDIAYSGETIVLASEGRSGLADRRTARSSIFGLSQLQLVTIRSGHEDRDALEALLNVTDLARQLVTLCTATTQP